MLEFRLVTDDLLWQHLKDLPYFRALLRAVEARFYVDLTLTEPVLDLGCGDGHFASLALRGRIPLVGVDPWWSSLIKAVERGVYRHAVQCLGAQLPFASGHFSTVISNSVLEHIPDLDAVLIETARVLRPGGTLIFCSPSENFLPFLSVSAALRGVRLQRLGETYERFFNRISRHHHCDDPASWIARLERCGFKAERWWYYFSRPALRALEWGHYFGLPSALIHAATRRWVLAPAHWNLILTEKYVRGYYEEPLPDHGAYVFFIANRV
jgi:SAM-dependent methyltransferase